MRVGGTYLWQLIPITTNPTNLMESMPCLCGSISSLSPPPRLPLLPRRYLKGVGWHIVMVPTPDVNSDLKEM